MSKLNELCHFATDKVVLQGAIRDFYVSTDSMQPDMGGVSFGKSKIPEGRVTSFLPGDILFSNIRTYFRKIWFSDREGACSNDVLVFRANEGKIEPAFLYYTLCRRDFTDFSIITSKGSKMPRGDKVAMMEFEVGEIPLSEQREIASILGTLDDKIELNRRMSATLEDMARSLYRSWFVDFDPVKAKMEGRKPDFMDDETAALFPDRFGADGLPEGWGRAPIGNLISDTIGGDWGKAEADEANDTPVFIIRGTDFSGIQAGGTANVPMRYTTRKKTSKRALQPFDIVLEVSGGSPTQPTGRSVLITNQVLQRFSEEVVPASFCRRLRPIDADFSLVACLHLQQLYLAGGTWEYQNQSTGIANFQTPRFLETEALTLPEDRRVVEAFSNMVGPLLERASTNETMHLAALRDSLLPKLMSGEIRVGEAREHIEEVA